MEIHRHVRKHRTRSVLVAALGLTGLVAASVVALNASAQERTTRLQAANPPVPAAAPAKSSNAATTPSAKAAPKPSSAAANPHAGHGTSNAAPAAAGPATGIGTGLSFDVSRIPRGNPGASGPRVTNTGERPTRDPDGIGAFRTVCQYSHMRADDPIVVPGRPGGSHLHTFWGNTATNASSTTESLRAGGNGTCRGGTVNRSAYWTPSIIDTRSRTPLAPFEIHVYYKSGYAGIAAPAIQNFPAGLRMVVGSATATRPQETGVGWSCLEGGQRGKSIPNCRPGTTLSMDLDFPQCSNGQIDSADHKSHVAYPVGGRCPSSHPRPIPAVSYHVHYRVPASGTAGWRLSSDMYPASQPGGLSVHGDWWGAWDPAIQLTWLNNCTRVPARSCGSHMLGDGRVIG